MTRHFNKLILSLGTIFVLLLMPQTVTAILSDHSGQIAVEFTFDDADGNATHTIDTTGNGTLGTNQGSIITGAKASTSSDTGQAWQITTTNTQYVDTDKAMSALGISGTDSFTITQYLWSPDVANGYFLYFGGSDNGAGQRMGLAGTATQDVVNYVGNSADVNTCHIAIYQNWNVVTTTRNTTHTTVYSNNTKVCQGSPAADIQDEFDMAIAGANYTGVGVLSIKMNITHACLWADYGLTPEEVDQLNGNLTSGQTCSGGGAGGATPDTPELTVTANDWTDGILISNYTVIVSNSTATFTNSTTTGTLKIGGNIANLTQYNLNITSNFSGGYYGQNRTFTISGIAQTENFRLYQSYVRFNSTQIFTGAIENGLSVSTPNSTNSTSGNIVTLYLRAGTYTPTAKTTNSVLNATTTFTALPQGNQTINLTFGNALVNFSLHNANSNTTIISGFTLDISITNLTGNLTYVIPAGIHNISDIQLLKNYMYVFNVTNAGNFTPNAENYTTTAVTQNFTMFLQEVHSISFKIYNEQTRNLITDANITIYMTSYEAFNQSTQNGTLYMTNLTPGDYEVTYLSFGTGNTIYPQRKYYLSLPLGSSQAIDLYLIDSTNGTEITMIIKDQNFEEVENATMQVLRYYTQTNAYEIIGMARTSFDGKSSMYLKLLQPNYKFRILTEGTTRFTSIGSILTTSHATSGLNFQINTESDPLSIIEGLENTQGNVTYFPSLGVFAFSFIDTGNEVDEACLEIIKEADGRIKSINKSCTTSNSATIVLAFDNSTQATYVGKGFFMKIDNDGQQIFYEADEKRTFSDPEIIVYSLGSYGVFLIALLILGIGLTFLYNPRIAMLATAFAFAIPVFAGLTVFSYVSIMAVVTGSFILSAIMKVND